MNLRQAAQRALKAMEDGEDRADMIEFSDALIALRAALAEPEQEPVAWEQFYPDIGKPQTTHWEGCEAVHPECRATPRKPLTDEEIDRITDQQWGQNNHKPIYAAHRAYARAVIAAYEAKQGEQHE